MAINGRARRRWVTLVLASALVTSGCFRAVPTDPKEDDPEVPTAAEIIFSRGAYEDIGVNADEAFFRMFLNGTGQKRIAEDTPGRAIQLSPDGGSMAMINRDGLVVATAAASSMKVVLRAQDPRLPAGFSGFESLSWSPDGQQLAFSIDVTSESDFVRRRDIYRINVNGQDLRPLAADPLFQEYLPSYGPDGRIAFARQVDPEKPGKLCGPSNICKVQMAIMNGDGSNKVALTESFVDHFNDVDFAPDGTKILYVRNSTGLWTMPPTPGATPTNIGVGSPARWTPDSSSIVYQDGFNIWITPATASGARTRLTDNQASEDLWDVGSPAAIVSIEDAAYDEGDADHVVELKLKLSRPLTQSLSVAVSVSPDTAAADSDYTVTANSVSFPAGSTTASYFLKIEADTLVERETEIAKVTLGNVIGPARVGDGIAFLRIYDDDFVRPVTSPPPSPPTGPTPQLNKIAFHSNRAPTSAGGHDDIWTMDPDGSNLRNVTGVLTERRFLSAEWSLDARRLAASFQVELFKGDIKLVNADGSGGVSDLVTDPASDGEAVFNPAPGSNGQFAFVSNRDGDLDVYLSTPGGTPVNVTNNDTGDGSPTFSRTGSSLAYETTVSGKRDIVVQNLSSTTFLPVGSPLNITNSPGFDDSNPEFSPVADRIAFNSNEHGDQDIFVMELGPMTRRHLTVESADQTNPTWSPDGQRLAFETATASPGNTEIYVMNATENAPQTNITNNPAADTAPAWGPASTPSSKVVAPPATPLPTVPPAPSPSGTGITPAPAPTSSHPPAPAPTGSDPPTPAPTVVGLVMPFVALFWSRRRRR